MMVLAPGDSSCAVSKARSSAEEGSLKIPQRLCVHASFTPPSAFNLQSALLRLCWKGSVSPNSDSNFFTASSFLPQPGLIRLPALL